MCRTAPITLLPHGALPTALGASQTPALLPPGAQPHHKLSPRARLFPLPFPKPHMQVIGARGNRLKSSWLELVQTPKKRKDQKKAEVLPV